MQKMLHRGMSKIQTSVAVVQNTKSDVLLVQRAVKEVGRNGTFLEWAFPGGRVRVGEESATIARQLTLFETGYDVKIKTLIHTRFHPDIATHIAYFAASLTGLHMHVYTESIKQVKWVNPHELPLFCTTNIDPVVMSYLQHPHVTRMLLYNF